MTEPEQSYTSESRRLAQRKRYDHIHENRDVVHCPKSTNKLRTHQYEDTLEYITGYKRPMRCRFCKELKDGTSSTESRRARARGKRKK